MDLNQVILHLLAKFGVSNLNAWWVMARTSLADTHTEGHTHTRAQTDAGNDNTRRAKLASGNKDRAQIVYWRTMRIISGCVMLHDLSTSAPTPLVFLHTKINNTYIPKLFITISVYLTTESQQNSQMGDKNETGYQMQPSYFLWLCWILITFTSHDELVSSTVIARCDVFSNVV